jgi:hypothetical protein
MVLRRFVSMRGYPKKIRSDAGSQLVAASKELNTMAQSWNWDCPTASTKLFLADLIKASL